MSSSFEQSQPDDPAGAFPFGLNIERFQSVKQDDVDEAAIELFRRAKEFHRDQDGREPEMISQ